MIIIVDTNIIFSAILNTNSTIGDLILTSEKVFQFWSCNFLLTEIKKHTEKLKKISKLNAAELIEAQKIIYKNLSLFDEILIPKIKKVKAYNLVKDVDLNDIAFVALNEYKQALLWTGDKVLINGLKAKAYDRIITTEEMINLRLELEK